MNQQIGLRLMLGAILLVGSEAAASPAPDNTSCDPTLTWTLESRARQSIELALQQDSQRLSARFDVRVTDARLTVSTASPYHPATFRAKSPIDRTFSQGDARYKARVDLRVEVRSPSGELRAVRTFEGRAAQTTPHPARHALRSFDSIHALGRTHPGCSVVPDAAHLYRRALADSLDNDGGAVARWIRQHEAD